MLDTNRVVHTADVRFDETKVGKYTNQGRLTHVVEAHEEPNQTLNSFDTYFNMCRTGGESVWGSGNQLASTSLNGLSDAVGDDY